ncbi:MAG: tRNA (N(6)-L-threonylcarbamoyladenosine(37)-C(2))-methylthiotransferase MtaB [Chloroflexi bacterium]|nr:tRNA (N(6)-L-threonylcarbamoyladenosine(37)-C(2))-methylthiotransferase MtaB [Chloroflexota bacterium]
MGCKLNLADTEILAQEFWRAGFQVSLAGAGAPDIYVLNTCTVTHVADRKARHLLRMARRHFPGALVVAVGCYGARAPQELSAIDGVDLVLGNAEKQSLVGTVAARLGAGPCAEATVAEEGLAAAGLLRTAIVPGQSRAFVKIQEGCNDHCSYCIIPKTRGASRFLPPNQVVAEIRAREDAGYREVVLTGTQLGDYGIPMPGSRRADADPRDQGSEGSPLAALLRRVLAETSIPRLRLSSIQPQDVTPALLELWRDPRLCPHVHLPLQSGSDGVLARMRRRYTAQEYHRAVACIRAVAPGVSITTDVITGFPGETEADFSATLALCEAEAFAAIHVFPYSPRAGTLATRWEGVPPESVKRHRTTALLELAQRSKWSHQARFIGAVLPVLWEERRRAPEVSDRPVWQGLTDNYLRVYASAQGDLAGAIVPTVMLRSEAAGMIGEPRR